MADIYNPIDDQFSSTSDLDRMSDSEESVRVLHVSGEPDQRQAVATALGRRPESVESVPATSGSEALERLDDSAVNCVVSAYDLPGMDGIALLEAIREIDDRLPFALLTTDGNERIASEAVSAGVTEYLRLSSESVNYDLVARTVLELGTEHREATAVTRTTARLQEIADHVTDVLWVFTHDWSEVRYVNSAYEDLFGRPIEDLYDDSRDFLESVHPADREAATREMERVSNGASGEMELRVNAAEEFRRWAWVRAEPIVDDGEVVQIVGFSRDVTERKRTENRFKTLTEQTPALTAVLGPDGTFTYASPSHEEFLGYDPDELLGAIAFEHIHPDDRSELIESFSALVERPDAVQTAEFRFANADGDWRWLDARGRNRIDDAGVEGIVISSRDVTRRKRQQRELERQRDRLDRFASLVTHDLRNPLAVASGHLELVRETGAEDSLDRIGESLDRMERIIDDVLELARQGEPIGDTAAVSVESVARSAWSTVATDDAVLVVDADTTLQADPDRLRTCFDNCFRNSMEHGSTGRTDGGPLTVTVGRTDDGFFVADDGTGIPDDEREAILEWGTTTSEAGTGLGLSIIQQIADAHGWTLSVTESDAGGARFEFGDVRRP